jgi:hypothetical protein
MKRAVILTIIPIFCCLLCCCLGALFWDGYYLPNKPCRPVTYPDGKVTTTEFSAQTTPDEMETVLEFFDQRLNAADPSVAIDNQWRKIIQAGSGYLYYCYAADINGISTESGCIYVNSDGKETQIKYMLLRSESGNSTCPQPAPNDN